MDQGQALSILYGSGADRHAETLLQVERRVAKAASGPLRARHRGSPARAGAALAR
jgi:hypothetical protein